MNFIATVKSTFIQDSYRMVKVVRFGKDDVQEVSECSPFGVDANPIANMGAVYAETIDDSEPVIVGYINKEQLASPGEIRLFSTDSDGNLKTYLWLKANGDTLLGGDADNAVRYSKLNEGLTTFTNFLNEQLVLISTGIATGGGSYTPGTASIDISQSKIEEIKTS
jgi:hypothetical protein